MKNNNMKINNAIIRFIPGAVLSIVILAGASFASTTIEKDVKTNHDVAHYTKVTAKETSRSVVKTAEVTARAGKDTGKGVGKGFSETGKATGKFFRHVGHVIV